MRSDFKNICVKHQHRCSVFTIGRFETMMQKIGEMEKESCVLTNDCINIDDAAGEHEKIQNGHTARNFIVLCIA